MKIDNYRLPSQMLKALAHTERLRLLDALRSGEECVCHLTAVLRKRQAYVSQQLMFLRHAGLIQDRKDGLRVYYRLKDARVIAVLDTANALAGMPMNPSKRQTIVDCPCPKCNSKLKKKNKSRENYEHKQSDLG